MSEPVDGAAAPFTSLNVSPTSSEKMASLAATTRRRLARRPRTPSRSQLQRCVASAPCSALSLSVSCDVGWDANLPHPSLGGQTLEGFLPQGDSPRAQLKHRHLMPAPPEAHSRGHATLLPGPAVCREPPHTHTHTPGGHRGRATPAIPPTPTSEANDEKSERLRAGPRRPCEGHGRRPGAGK